MSKTLYWILAVGTVTVVAVFAGVVLLNDTGEETPPPTTSNQYPNFSSTVTVPTTPGAEPSDTKTLTAQGGGTIVVKNFLQDPATKSDDINPGHYYLGNYIDPRDPTASSTPPYVVEYIDATHYFSIALLQEPIGAVRQQAEQYLIQQLGITESQMCLLNYSVSVPVRVSQLYAGQSLGFSFCPGATPL